MLSKQLHKQMLMRTFARSEELLLEIQRACCRSTSECMLWALSKAISALAPSPTASWWGPNMSHRMPLAEICVLELCNLDNFTPSFDLGHDGLCGNT